MRIEASGFSGGAGAGRSAPREINFRELQRGIKEPAMQRWILHIDMDAFFASVEQLDHPEWRGKPVIVGGAGRGVVAAASYEARAFGVHSAMPSFKARQLCPQGIFTAGDRRRYAELSRQIMDTLRDFSPLVEPASIDEAYLDAGGLDRLFGPVESLGRDLKEAVFRRTGLTCSVGAAPVKFLAKIASALHKPDGLTIIHPPEVEDFMRDLPLEKIPGLGEHTLKSLASHGLKTAGDAGRYPEEFWLRRFGRPGAIIYERCRGIDGREVEPETQPKSESAEHTLEEDSLDREELKFWLLRQAERVGEELRRRGCKGRTVTLKLKYADFSRLTRSRTLKKATSSTRLIFEIASSLLDELNPQSRIRLIGLGVSNFGADAAEAGRALPLPGLSLSVPPEDEAGPGWNEEKENSLDQTLDLLRLKFGEGAIVRGRIFERVKREGS
jgi:DNA polymerase-4